MMLKGSLSATLHPPSVSVVTQVPRFYLVISRQVLIAFLQNLERKYRDFHLLEAF